MFEKTRFQASLRNTLKICNKTPPVLINLLINKPRLVVPHSTCPSLSPSPPAHSFKFPAGPGEGGGHGKPFHVCLRRLGVPPRPPLTEMEDQRATVTDSLQSTTFRLYSSAAAPVTAAVAPRHPLPWCQGLVTL